MTIISLNSTPATSILTNYQQIIQNAPPVKLELPNTPPSVTIKQSSGNISIHV
ncbi:MAG: hypothetical protein ACYCSQ_02020 [bacterium]